MRENNLDTFNMLIMGKTGVGKSALLNYFAGKELAESGMSSGGMTRGIKKYNVKINDYNHCIADTEGLEAGNDKYWFKLMDDELGLNSDRHDLATWYHSIIYCIGANGSKVEDTDLNMIEKVIDAGFGCIIAFTKADVTSEEDTLILKATINKHFKEKGYEPKFDFVDISSISNKIEAFGKEELFEKIKEQFLISLVNRADLYIFNKAFKMIDDFEKEIENIIMSADICDNKKQKKELISNIETKFSYFAKKIKEEINNRYTSVFKQIEQILQMLNIVFCNTNYKERNNIDNDIDINFDLFMDKCLSGIFKFDAILYSTLFLGLPGFLISSGIILAKDYIDKKHENKKILKNIKSKLDEIRDKLKEQNKNFLNTLEKRYIIAD